MATYQNLDVWKKSMELVKDIYDTVKFYPREEQYALTSRNDMPFPLNALWYSPVNRSLVSFLLLISSSRTFLSISAVVSMRR